MKNVSIFRDKTLKDRWQISWTEDDSTYTTAGGIGFASKQNAEKWIASREDSGCVVSYAQVKLPPTNPGNDYDKSPEVA